MNPQQLTALNLDKTGLLNDMLQFSFLAFLMGQSLEGEPLSAYQCITRCERC